MKNSISKYLSIVAMLGCLAWFLWNPDGWKFEWEPLVCFIISFSTYITADMTSYNSSQKNFGHVNDIALFKKLQEALPSNDSIDFIRTHDFGGSFNIDNVIPIRDFNHYWDNAEHEFIDSELEKLRKELLEKSSKFSLAIGMNTSPNSAGFQSVYPDTHLDSPEDFEKRIRSEVKEIHDAADELIKIHQKIMRVGRKKLNISA
jgi:hypothetical protein